MLTHVFELHFAGTSPAQLVETRFFPGPGSSARVVVRGQTPGAYRNAGTFQLSSAVRALSLIFVKSAAAYRASSPSIPPIILGSQGSLAASLDYALDKQPNWLIDMFGSDASGRCSGRRLFQRTNPNRKRPGPVVLRVNEHALPPDAIHIFWNGARVETYEVFRALLVELSPPGEVDDLEKSPPDRIRRHQVGQETRLAPCTVL